jgi:FKBP-type peptidyl-prolyl cis-trans isomerase SlyD
MTSIVRDNMVVSLAYTLKLENGEVVDYADADDPLEYLHGAGNIVPGLERELTGMQIGETKEVAVKPVDAYGEYDEEAVERIDRKQLPKNMPPLALDMELEVSDADDNIMIATVREIGPNHVTLDFNHPLAGQTLFFTVNVVGVRDASEEEIAHGHVHGMHGFEDELDFEDDEFDFEDDEDFEDDDYMDDEDDLKTAR